MFFNKILKVVLFTVILRLVGTVERQNYISEIKQIEFCNGGHQNAFSRSLLYVSTLDGKLTALNISKNGTEQWSIETGPDPLISSSIHRLELTSNGKWVRIIPSLNGILYKFDGQTVEPIPITVNDLLSSSYKFADDLVISGGIEIRSYGISARTGQILYKCSMQGCVNVTESISSDSYLSNKGTHEHIETHYVTDNVAHSNKDQQQQHDLSFDDVIIVRRQTQTVRATESRSGIERWNFSIGNHEVDLIQNSGCQEAMNSLDIDIKVILAEGTLLAFNRNDIGTILWKYKFSHPIVNVWRINYAGQIQNIDLFDVSHWISNSDKRNNAYFERFISPKLYVGMFEEQLYIQESRQLLRNIKTQLINKTSLPSIPWKPVLITFSSSLYDAALSNEYDSKTALSTISSLKFHGQNANTTVTTALSVAYVSDVSEHVNDYGFFLFTSFDNKTPTICASENPNNTNLNIEEHFTFDFIHSDDTPVKIIIVSLWFWWKEILVISLTSSILLNLFLSPRIRREKEFVIIEKPIILRTAVKMVKESVTSTLSNNQFIKDKLPESDHCENIDEFKSRFLNDFVLIQCLGRGGFGVVFEAKNKLDDCNYAIKRIILPNKKESRDRVMREVKTLANCEHKNIVRYFHSWIESPPLGWQEKVDKNIFHKDIKSTSDELKSPSFSNTYEKKDLNRVATIINDVKDNTKIIKSSSLNSSNSKKDCSILISNENELLFNCVDKDNNDIKFSSGDGNSDSFQIEFRASSCEDISISKNNNLHAVEKLNSTSSLKQHSESEGRKELASPNPIKTNCTPQYQKKDEKIYLYIQMQLCRKESLKDWLRENTFENRITHVHEIFKQIVDAVCYVHDKGLIHRDLKPSNIFFSLDGQIKIGDFGLVTDMPTITSSLSSSMTPAVFHKNHKFINIDDDDYCNSYTKQVGTHLYMSPEQLSGSSYDSSIDIYSLGLIFFELLVYFSTEMERIITLQNVRNGKFPKSFDKQFPNEHKLLSSMLSTNPKERPKAFEIRKILKVGCC